MWIVHDCGMWCKNTTHDPNNAGRGCCRTGQPDARTPVRHALITQMKAARLAERSLTMPTKQENNCARLLCAVMFLAVLAFCWPVWAAESAADYIEPRIERPNFQRLIDSLGLGSDQRTIVEFAFVDYTQSMSDLAASLDQQANGIGRETVQAALSGKARVAPDDLKRMRIDILKVYEHAGPAADQAIETFVSSVEVVLAGEQLGAFEQAIRELRREILLHPRQLGGDSQEYAGDGVDLLQLVALAVKEGGELYGLDEDPLQALTQLYAQQLDTLLIGTSGAYRQNRIQRKIAQIDKNTEAIQAQDQAGLELWKQLFQLNQGFVQQIGDLAAAQIDENARLRWIDRFHQASFPWLFPRRKPDRQIEWIRKEAAGDQLAKAETIYRGYLDRRSALAKRAIDMMLQGRLDHQVMLYSMMDPTAIEDRACRDIYEELLRNTGEQANLDSMTAGQLESALEGSKRESLREAMKRPDSPSRKR